MTQEATWSQLLQQSKRRSRESLDSAATDFSTTLRSLQFYTKKAFSAAASGDEAAMEKYLARMVDFRAAITAQKVATAKAHNELSEEQLRVLGQQYQQDCAMLITLIRDSFISPAHGV